MTLDDSKYLILLKGDFSKSISIHSHDNSNEMINFPLSYSVTLITFSSPIALTSG